MNHPTTTQTDGRTKQQLFALPLGSIKNTPNGSNMAEECIKRTSSDAPLHIIN